MQRAIASIVLFVVSTFAGAESILPGYEKINAPDVQGKTLKIPAENFSIDSPAEDWVWLKPSSRGSDLSSYVCFHSSSNELFVVTSENDNSGKQTALDEKDLNQFIKGFSQTELKYGKTLKTQSHLPSNIPIPGSYRITLEWNVNSKKEYWIVYVVYAERRIYFLQSVSKDGSESDSFRSVATNFKILKTTSRLATSHHTSEFQKDLESGDIVGAFAYAIGYLLIPVVIVVLIVRQVRKSSKLKAPAAGARMVQFSFYDPQGKAQTVSIPKVQITIGSAADCDLMFEDLQPFHCRIYLSTQGYYAEDLGGGITINSVAGSGFVRSDDVIQMNSHTIRITLV
ncbi:MAG: hypothetical protein C5B54_01345 [Acidobacteria bacterium]|nr:MAG: hypothetical protein C5B54_01345 [Acidobacteriota bacterium]